MDARILKTKQAIHRAVIGLLGNCRLSEMTVSAVCREADINRNTFYAHYRTPDEVVDEISNQLIERLNQIAIHTPRREGICLAICSTIYHDREVFCTLVSPNCEHRYLDVAIAHARNSAQRYTTHHQDHSELGSYYHEFVIGGCVYALERWAENGFQQTPEEMGAILHDFYTKYIS